MNEATVKNGVRRAVELAKLACGCDVVCEGRYRDGVWLERRETTSLRRRAGCEKKHEQIERLVFQLRGMA